MIPYSPISKRPTRSKKAIKKMLNIEDAPSPNFNDRTRPIRYVVLHYTGMKSQEAALKLLRDDNPLGLDYEHAIKGQLDEEGNKKPINLHRVSAHYVVFTDGRIFRLVDEAKRAWHAGSGEFGGEKDMNSASIGIEICNGGHDFGLPPYPLEQIEAVCELVEDIKKRNGLDKMHIIGHSDLAPKRKEDPGEHFPWHILEDKGIALKIPVSHYDNDKTILISNLNEASQLVDEMKKCLTVIGYAVDETLIYDDTFKHVVIAFQRRYRQSDVSGIIDVDTFEKAKRLAQILNPAKILRP